jgi:putative CocE/NonD family hydrolase
VIRLLGLLLLGVMPAITAAPAFASPGAPRDLRLPANRSDADLARSMPALARDTLASYRRATKAPDPGVLFRLEMVAGADEAAIADIDAVRKAADPGGPPLYLQYEVHARAKQRQAADAPSYAQAWDAAFAERFGALDDRIALQAEFGFGGYLPRMRGDLDAALAKLAGRRRLTLDEALDVVRKYQVWSSYAAFQPLFAAALAKDDARRYVIDRNAMIETPDGAHLAALVVRPAHATPLPALFQFTIYANDDWAWADAKKSAAYGYAGVVAYTRGKGRSSDAIVPYGHEGADAAAAIDWIARQPWSDGRVGMYGGSYSGYTQWAALKHRPEALKAIATSATTAPGIDVPMEGGVFLNFIYPWPLYAASNRTLDDARYGDQARWERLDRAWYASGRPYRELPAIDGSANPVFAEWLRHPAYDAYWRALTPQGDEFAGIDIPVLVTTGYYDGAQIGALHYFREHLRHRPDADQTLLVGPYEHFTMQTGVPPLVQGYAPDPVARIDLQALRLAWFDHVLKGAPKPSLLSARVNWEAMGADAWRHADSLEAMATRTQRYYLVPGAAGAAGASGKGSEHLLSPQPQPQAATGQQVDFTDRSDAAWRPSPDVVNAQLDPQAGLVFATAPFAQDTEFAGPFSGVLDFTVNKRDMDVIVGVYEQAADGRYQDLAWWLQRASYARDRSQRHLLQPGVPQRLEVRDTRLLGKKLAAGSRLVVTIGIVKEPDRQLNLGSGRDPSDESLQDAGVPLEVRWQGSSYLDFGLRE